MNHEQEGPNLHPLMKCVFPSLIGFQGKKPNMGDGPISCP